MAIDSLNQISNEQLLAMNMIGNGQLTSESSSTSNTNDESNLAFQLVMQNLMETSKNSNQNNINAVSENLDSASNQLTSITEKVNIDSGVAVLNNTNKISQNYAAGQNLEDIPMILKNNYLDIYSKSASTSLERSDVDMKKIYNIVNSTAKKYGVDSNLLLAIIKQESDFNPNSTSSSGAAGLMQIMPQNFAHLGITDGYDVEQNINGGTKMLKEYLNQFDGNKELALMAYNGGPGTMQRRGVSSTSDLYKMPEETQNYVPKVMNYFRHGV